VRLSDVHITGFESKYFYSHVAGPETAIRRADEDGNGRDGTPTADYTAFRPHAVLSRVSLGARCGRRAARVVLERAYGRQSHDLTISDAGAPGIVLHYSDLRDITDDVSDARVFGGIHFRFDQERRERDGRRTSDVMTTVHLLRPLRRECARGQEREDEEEQEEQ
jgi:hypothetical protein